MTAEEARENIFGGPTKRFFVSMLTRDIELSDAILDLVDNCVDGAMRTSRGQERDEFESFQDYEARLKIDHTQFQLTDNCGGIPENYILDAFHLGRPKIDKDSDLPTIGMFGIGMKRAIFKMANEALVISNTTEAKNSVVYSKEWLNPENDSWDLPLEKKDPEGKRYGVDILIDDLKEGIAKTFGRKSYVDGLKHDLSLHFGYIMQKGFKIFVNDEELKPSTLPLMSSDFVEGEKEGLLPFDFEMTFDDVDIKVTVGFFRNLVRDEEIDAEAEGANDIDKAGISVVCNDRVVLLSDKSMATGWGDGGAPRYHPQFRAIAGLITLYSADASKLPLSTTKRGLDASSDVYLTARQQCIDGIKTFTAFTNKWKGMERAAAPVFKEAKLKDVRTEVRLAKQHGRAVRQLEGAKRFRPSLPVPDVGLKRSRISFSKPVEDVDLASKVLFGETGLSPSVVGEEAFDRVLKEARNVDRQ